MKKKLINIAVNLKKQHPCTIKTDMLVVGIFTGNLKQTRFAEDIDKKTNKAISKLIKLGDFKGKKLSAAVITANGSVKAERILLIGLGEKKKCDVNTISNAASLACKIAVDKKCSSVALCFDIDSKNIETCSAYQRLVEGAFFGAYRYDEFVKADKNDRPKKITISVISDSSAGKVSKAIKAGAIIGQAQNLTRTLCNRPSNIVYPATLAAEAKKIAAKIPNLTCQILNFSQLKDQGFGGIVSVGQGSARKPVMIILKYQPAKTKKTSAAPVALVGKAITFDSGGISIKPGAGMDSMKMDMTGGASVIGAVKAIAELKLPVPVYGIICAAENMPGADSYRPGDIITTHSGKTVEILNTDAEGRIILCDGISYAKKIKCQTIIDICTLTGACFVALGHHNAGLMGNNDKLIGQLKQASAQSDEPLWHLPCSKEYADEMKSKIADLQNIGPDRWGGAIRAAAFLGEFAGETNWAHLDIASKTEAKGKLAKIASAGSVGFGVRVMTKFIANLVK